MYYVMNDQVYACCNNIRSRTTLGPDRRRNKQFRTWGAVYGTVKFDTSIGLEGHIKVYCLYLFLFLSGSLRVPVYRETII